MHILIDTTAGSILGFVNSAEYAAERHQVVVAAPPGFAPDAADEWAFVGGALCHDPDRALAQAQAARISVIKAEASGLIAALDWRLARAQEREAAGWATLSGVDDVLALREAIRRSSDAAETAVLALGDVSEVQAFTWEVSISVTPPCRVTHAAFLDALRAQGEDVIPAILAAKDASPALLQWWTYFDKADIISATDPRLLAGLQGLEIAGFLPAGGADAVVSSLSPSTHQH